MPETSTGFIQTPARLLQRSLSQESPTGTPLSSSSAQLSADLIKQKDWRMPVLYLDGGLWQRFALV